MKTKTIKLNLGCGWDHKKGFINVDIREDVDADLIHDITKPFPFDNNTVSEVVAQDVFEHLTIEQQTYLLMELHRLLIAGGKLSIRIPNNDDIWERFSDDPDTRNLFLFGNTSITGVWGSHKSGHTLNSFLELAAISGFSNQRYSSLNTNYKLEFVKKDLPKLRGIVFVVQTLGMGGAEKFMTQLLTWFGQRNIPVKAWTTSVPFNDSLAFSNIKTMKIPIVIDFIGDWRGLIKGLILFPAACVYYAYLTYINRRSGTFLLSGFIEKILVTPWAKVFNAPVVWVEYGPLGSVFSKFLGLPKLLYRMVSRLPDYVIEPSYNTRESNLNITGISFARTKVIPCGLNPLKPAMVNMKPFTAYCVSRMEEGKGQDLLIRAWPRVLDKFPKARLYLIGEGAFKEKLTKIVKDLKLTGNVIFLGKVDNLSKEISRFSLSVCPSVWQLEGFGLVLLEAMSLGKPIVCFDSAPYSEIVNSDCAILVEKGNIKKLSNAIIKIFSNPRLAKILGKKGKERYNYLFKLEKIAYRYLRVLLQAQISAQIDNYLNKN